MYDWCLYIIYIYIYVYTCIYGGAILHVPFLPSLALRNRLDCRLISHPVPRLELHGSNRKYGYDGWWDAHRGCRNGSGTSSSTNDGCAARIRCATTPYTVHLWAGMTILYNIFKSCMHMHVRIYVYMIVHSRMYIYYMCIHLIIIRWSRDDSTLVNDVHENISPVLRAKMLSLYLKKSRRVEQYIYIF